MGSSQSRVTIEEYGYRARVDAVEVAKKLKGGKDTKDTGKLTAKRGLIGGKASSKVAPNDSRS